MCSCLKMMIALIVQFLFSFWSLWVIDWFSENCIRFNLFDNLLTGKEIQNIELIIKIFCFAAICFFLKLLHSFLCLLQSSSNNQLVSWISLYHCFICAWYINLLPVYSKCYKLLMTWCKIRLNLGCTTPNYQFAQKIKK